MDLIKFWKNTSIIKQALVFILTIYLTLGVPFQAWAVDIYVNAGSGNNGNAGTQAAPYKTITFALSSAAMGDIVHVLPGTYDTANGEIFPLSPGDEVTLRSDNGSGAIAPGSTFITGAEYSALIDFSSNITNPASTRVEGFTVTNTTGTGIRLSGGDNMNISPVITNNTLTGNTNDGIYMNAMGYSSASVMNPEISNNTITTNSTGIRIRANSGGSISPTLSNNSISNNALSGIDARANGYSGIASISPTITDNLVSGNDKGIALYGGWNATITGTISGNTVSGNLNTLWGGIDIGASYGSASPAISNNTIETNSASGIRVIGGFMGGASPAISGNTITQNTKHGIEVLARIFHQ